MPTVYYWRYFNETISDYEYVWDEEIPTACKNPEHVMQVDSITRLNEITNRVIETREEYKGTGGHYKLQGERIVITQPKTHYIKTHNYPIVVSNLTCYPNQSNIGDMLNIYVGPLPLTPCVADSDKIYLPQPVIKMLFIGVFLYKSNDRVCEIVELELDYVKVVYTGSDRFTSGDTVSMLVEFVKDLPILSTDKIKVGESLVGGVRLEKNLPITIEYTNNSSTQTEKILHYSSEFLY